MATSLPLRTHVETLALEGQRFTDLAERVDLEAAVPTCPEWTVHDLIAHQGEVHRWATDNLTGQWDELSYADQADRVAAPIGPALLPWFRTGVDELLAAVENAVDNVQAAVFLLDAPPPRTFWARRQANETTMHRVDLLAASLGRVPLAAEVEIDDERALDGIDELLQGFVPRPRSKLRASEPFSLAVEPSGSSRRWLLQVGEEPVVTRESDEPADATFSGDPVAVYLGLWNRGDEMRAEGDERVPALWRELVRVQWH